MPDPPQPLQWWNADSIHNCDTRGKSPCDNFLPCPMASKAGGSNSLRSNPWILNSIIETQITETLRVQKAKTLRPLEETRWHPSRLRRTLRRPWPNDILAKHLAEMHRSSATEYNHVHQNPDDDEIDIWRLTYNYVTLGIHWDTEPNSQAKRLYFLTLSAIF